ncbi:MAG: SIS domain-containing protein [Nitrososphaerota archaeon]|nr:SIS domain-containing protein [Candidatus Calditenuaceae archaeon]MDW8074017.1 SIS domain-containing protein [Nitrososphaerota archaeon]
MKAEHFMIREIREGPPSFRETLESLPNMESLAGEILSRYRCLLTCSSGSSHHAGLCLSYAASRLAGVEAYSVLSSEYSEHIHSFIGKEHLLVAISQSGESADTLRAARLASAKGVDILAITAAPASTLGSMARYVLNVRCGVERAVPATKSFMAQLAAVYSLALGLASPRLGAGELGGLRGELAGLPDLLSRVVDGSEELAVRCAKEMAELREAFLLGQGPSYIAALEASLKLKETCGVHAEAYSVREFRHGPISLLDRGVACFLIVPPEPGDSLDVFERVAAEARSLGVYTMTLSHEGGVAGSDLTLPRTSHVFATAVEVAPFQLLAYYLALEKSLDPDRPRLLKKVVQ